MGKQKKKRNKVYRGSDAKSAKPTVIRMEAANRNRVQQWWFEKKPIAKPVLLTSGVVLIVVWLLFELLRIIF